MYNRSTTSPVSDTGDDESSRNNPNHNGSTSTYHLLAVTNDSFPLGGTPVLGSTRPYDGRGGTADVERFLNEAPVTNHTMVPGMVPPPMGLTPLQISANSSFVSAQPTVDGGSSLGGSSARTAAPSATFHVDPVSSASVQPIYSVPPLTAGSPMLLSAAESSAGRSRTAAAPIYATATPSTEASGRRPTQAFPLPTSASSPSQSRRAVSRPMSPASSFGVPASNHSSASHGSELGSVSMGTEAAANSPRRQAMAPLFPLGPARGAAGSPGSPLHPVAVGASTGSLPSLTSGEVAGGYRGYLPLRGGSPNRRNSPNHRNSPRQRRSSPGRGGDVFYAVSMSGGGRGSVSATGRQRGNVATSIRASESSAGSAGSHTPSWLSAVERMKRGNGDAVQPVLPYDQSKLGMQARRVAQTGGLTAGKLRALEMQNSGGGGGNSGGRETPTYYGPAATRYGSGSPESPSGRRGGGNFPTLVAQEVSMQSTARNAHGGAGGGAFSEQGTWRRPHIRAAGSSSMSGGRAGAVGTGYRTPSSPHLLTATETSGGAAAVGGAPPSLFSTASSSVANGSTKTSLTTHKLANLFQKHSGSAPNLFAMETSVYPAVGPVLTASEECTVSGTNVGAGELANGAFAAPPPTVGTAGAGGGGGGSGSSGDGSKNGEKRPLIKAKGGSGGDGGPPKKRCPKEERDEDERDESNFKNRNINALHAIPWEQRRQMPMTGFGTRFFALLSSPRFWEKLDWTFRASLLTVLPTMVLSLEPTTAPQFPMASSLAFNAFWITMPTFGSGLREFFIALKGFAVGLILLLIVIASQVEEAWKSLLFLFFFTLIVAFVAEEIKKTTAYVLASTIMQYVTDPVGTNYKYVGIYYESLLIALSFAIAAFLLPFIRWSSDIARHYIKAMGNALSIDVQGTCQSFWVRTPLERELNVVHLRQLRATAEKCISKIETAYDESGYEPHTGKYMAHMQVRFKFCISIHNILGSMSHVVELLAENPALTDTPMCKAFGQQIEDDLAIICSAMDSMILKIVDFNRQVTQQEIQYFQEARDRFQEALSRVREDVILTNENYETDESDVFLGFFMFSVDELCEEICNFKEEEHPTKTLWLLFTLPVRDVKSSLNAIKNLYYTAVHRRTIPRRMKEAIKLSLCMTLPCIFQIYALGNNQVSPMAGAAIIALIYNPTGSESFHYATGRLLGTVVGSIAALFAVQIANGTLGILYVFIAILSFSGAYVQASPGFYALGNAIVCSTISVCTQYQNQNAAMTRIQQNCFAILMYFAVASILWPMRAHTKVKMGLDVSLRCFRESTARLLRNLDMPPDAGEVVADVTALLKEMAKKIGAQARFIPGAVEEPTMSSAEYPEDAWKKIVSAEKQLHSALSMMCFAYNVFMSSRADDTTELSVHWVVLHRIAPHAQDLSDLLYAVTDLYLLSLSKTTVVPLSHLTRMRIGMVEAHQAILETYIQTIQRKVAGDDSDDGGGGYDDSDDGYDDYDGGSGYGSGSYSGNGSHNFNATNHHHHNNNSNSNNNNNNHSGNKTNELASLNGTNNGGDASPDRATDHKDGGAAGKSQKKEREGSDKDDDEESSDGEKSNHNDKEKKPKAPKKKKMGYLGYDITPEEEAALRNFVCNRVAGNNSFLGTSAGLNQTMNVGKSVNNKTFTSAAMAGLSGATEETGGNDVRLTAMAGTDDGLAAALRRKHKVAPKEKNTTSTTTPGAGGEDPNAVSMTELKLTNASFLKNSFVKNTSFLGGWFSKKKPVHDLDDMAGTASVSCNSALAQTRRGQGRDNASSVSAASLSRRDVSPTQQPQKHPHGSDDEATEFSDIEDDPKTKKDKKKKKAEKKVHMAESVVDGGSKTSLGLAKSAPLGSSPKGLQLASSPLAKSLPPGATADSGIQLPSVLASSPAGETELKPLTKGAKGGTAPSSLASSPPAGAGEASVTVPMAGGPPSAFADAAPSESTADKGKDTAQDEITSIQVSAGKTAAVGLPPLAHRPSTAENTPEDFRASAGRPEEDGAPHQGHPAGGEKKADGSGEGSNNTHSTEMKYISGEPTTTDSDPNERSKKEGKEKGNGEPAKENPLGQESGRAVLSTGSFSTVRSNANALLPNGHLPDLLQDFMSGDHDGSSDGGDGAGGYGGSEVLNNISFFDAEKGEFVLTNHDIHSLEAFLFGTRAVVAYLNELQKAILEMQHATELAKRL